MDLAKLNQYLEVKNKINGWITPGAAQLFAWVDYIQKQEGIVGNLFEIGVHHGKTSILLSYMTDSVREQLGVCDVFDMVEKNVTGSGRGDKEIFLDNFKSYVGDPSFLRIFVKPSGELLLDEIGTGYRFFHVDGGHLAEEVFGDLCLADSALLERGIVAVDDYFNENWPGVSEGVCRFMIERPNRLVPVAVGFNKVLFSKPPQQKWYLDQLHTHDWKTFFRELDPDAGFREFFGVETLVYTVDWKKPVLKRMAAKFKSLVSGMKQTLSDFKGFRQSWRR